MKNDNYNPDIKLLPIGYDDFKTVIESNYLFIDKSLLIRDIIRNNAQVKLFTRPRRFGKTLNLSMIRYFFEDGINISGEKEDYHDLFNGLKISEYDDIMAKQGKNPVLFLTLKGAKQADWEGSSASIKSQISHEFFRHRYLADRNILGTKVDRFNRIIEDTAKETDYQDALAFLSECLYIYHGKKVIILIDEYDVPLECSYTNHFYDRMVTFIRSLFESSLKTNPYLEFAVLTGCLRVSRESIFTGMNNLAIYSILSSEFSEYFGFTDDEMQFICDYYEMPDKYETMKDWYDGYVFGDTNLYNPWSAVQQITAYIHDPNAFSLSYWANSSSNSIVRQMIEKADKDTRKEIEDIIHGNNIEKVVHEDITYDEIDDNMDNLWNFMFFTGYFKKVSMRQDGETLYVKFAIPNREVKYIFNRKINDWFNDTVVKQDRTALLDAFVNMNAEFFEAELNRVLMQSISYHDYYENFYHGILTGILSGSEMYIVKSNRESGNGRSDLYAKSVNRLDKAFIIEVKVAKTMDSLEAAADEALQQIIDMKYDEELRADGYYNIAHYGIAFFGKNCRVKVCDVL